jgi:hypothetical protein
LRAHPAVPRARVPSGDISVCQLRRISHIRPRLGRGGWTPPALACRWSGIGNALEHPDVGPHATNRAGLCANADLQRVGQLAVHNDHRERDAEQFQNRAHAPLPDRMFFREHAGNNVDRVMVTIHIHSMLVLAVVDQRRQDATPVTAMTGRDGDM